MTKIAIYKNFGKQLYNIVSHVKLIVYYTFFVREILVYFTHGHSAKAQASLRILQSHWRLYPIVNADLFNCFRSELPSTWPGCE